MVCFLCVTSYLGYSTIAEPVLANSEINFKQPPELENIGPIIFNDGTYGLSLKFRSLTELARKDSLKNSDTRDALNGVLEVLCISHGPRLLIWARKRFVGYEFKVFAISIVWAETPLLDAVTPLKVDAGWRSAFKISDGQCGERLSK